MTARLILTYPDSRLRKISEPVSEGDWGSVPQWCQDIRDTMVANAGLGLAAPQVGIHKRIFAVDSKDLDNPQVFQQETGDGVLFFVNPVLTLVKKETAKSVEACLSVPGVVYPVKRSPVVNVEYTTLHRETVKVQVEGEDAVVLQHEFDHLNGRLFVDRLNSYDKKEFLGRFEKPKREKSDGEINQIREQRRSQARKNRKK